LILKKILLIATLLTLVCSCGKNKEGSKDKTYRVVDVTAKTIKPSDVPVTFNFIAQTQSSRLVNIQARVNGFLEKRVYTEGSIVKEGDVLFLMDKKPFQVQVDGAKAALSRQRAAMETAKLNLDRTKPLVKLNALSQKDLDDANGSYESSAASVEQALAQLATTVLNLSYCTITSPVTGISSSAQQQDGAYINVTNSLLTTVAVLDPIWVNFSLSENQLQGFRNQVAKGELIPPKDGNYDVEVLLVDGSTFPHQGKITFQEPSYNAQTGTFLVRAEVKNPKGILRPYQYVHVRLHGAIRPNAVLVPQTAIQQGAKGPFVWVVNNEGKAEYRPVVLGEWEGNNWFISGGLVSGDQVIVEGTLTLQPGIAVNIKNQEK
jgi:membrane fusion protein (multidrug efflux system)